MGTFSVNFGSTVWPNVIVSGLRGSLTTKGWCSLGGDSTNAGLSGAIGQYTLIDHSAIADSISFEIAPSGLGIFIDTLGAIEWNILPMGILFTNVTINISGVAISAIGATSTFRFTCGLYDSGAISTALGPIAQNINPGVAYTSLQILNIVAKLAFTSSGNAVISSPTQVLAFDGIYLTGNYIIQKFQATMTPANPFTAVADPITITSQSGNANAADLSHVVSINIGYYDSSSVFHIVNIPAGSFVSQSQFSIVFDMINFSTAIQVFVDIVSDGTQFSGSITLGSLPTINFTDGTGIYVLSPGKTNDTLYAQGTNPIQTVSVAIPNPFIKTAFLP